MDRLLLCIALALTIATTSGCAVLEQQNRLTLNTLDRMARDSRVSKSTTARVALAPLAVSGGLIAGAFDMAVVTPVRAVKPAAHDTYESLWENPKGSELRQAMLLLPKVIATPLVFTTDWTFRSLFATKF
jgi:hypothetical protein